MLKAWFLHQNQCFRARKSIEASENGPKWFHIPQNIGFDTRTMSRACPEAELLLKLEFNILKYLLTSYSPSTQFLTFRSISGFWKWPKMIPHTPKQWFCHMNHISSMLRSGVTTKVRISHLEVLLDLLQCLHPVLDLQVYLRLLNPIQPDVSDHGRDLTGGKSYPPYKFSIKTVQMTIKFML